MITLRLNEEEANVVEEALLAWDPAGDDFYSASQVPKRLQVVQKQLIQQLKEKICQQSK